MRKYKLSRLTEIFWLINSNRSRVKRFTKNNQNKDKYLKRAGLDYWPLVTVNKYGNFEKFLASKATKRIISFSKKNGLYLKDFTFKQDDILLFGREDSGLPDSIIDKSDFLISIFMPNIQTGNNDQKGVRSLNLSVACGIAIYEAHKQINFQNGN